MKITFYTETSERPLKTINMSPSLKKGDSIELDECMFEVLKTNYVVMEEAEMIVYVKPIGKMFV